ncbi:MAG: VWA domain-containing protein [Paludibacter sp.]|jgi:Ca-activated chloride channel family protein|nr:VWA domain-containing protein [Paludibacter sp.]
MFRFAHPEFLFLLLIIPLLVIIFVLATIKKRQNLIKFGNLDLLTELMPNVSSFRPKLKFTLQTIVILLIIVVLAQPQFGTRLQTEKRKGIEVMLALDVSNSMMAQDVQPNRLEKSKQIIAKLIDDMNNDKVGMAVFAGDAYIQLPITVDYVSAKMFLQNISPTIVPRQGTAIGSAIDLCIRSFGEKSETGRAIILITDGENHEDDAAGAAKLAHEKGINVFVVGIGRPEGAPIPIDGTMSFRKDAQGNVVVSKLNEEMCKNIASAGGGVYVRADNTNNAYKIISTEISKLAKSEIETQVFSDFNEQFQSFAFLALFLLIAEFLIFDRKNKRLSKLRIFDLKEKITK